MSNEENAIVVHQMDLTPKGAMQQANSVASAFREFIVKSAISIQGRKYLKVESWLALARGFGCTVGTRDVEKVDGGIRATAEIRRISDGAILATAEGFVGDDEKMWSGRPMFARRAMAQTRAASRACRAAFSFVVLMIDSGLSTTPAEEMGADEQQAPQPTEAPLEVMRPGQTAQDAIVERKAAELRAAGNDAKARVRILGNLSEDIRRRIIQAATAPTGPEAA